MERGEPGLATPFRRGPRCQSDRQRTRTFSRFGLFSNYSKLDQLLILQYVCKSVREVVRTIFAP